MPGSLGYEETDAETFADYGADYVKNDDCRTIYSHAFQVGMAPTAELRPLFLTYYPPLQLPTTTPRFQDYNAMMVALEKQVRPMLHDVKAPDLSPAQAVQASHFRRVAKDLKNTWHDMVRVLDTGDDKRYLSMVGPTNGFFSDFDMLVRRARGEERCRACCRACRACRSGSCFPPHWRCYPALHSQEVGNHADGTNEPLPVMTMREWESHFSLWAALKSPLQIGSDIRNINASVLKIMANADVIAVNQGRMGVAS